MKALIIAFMTWIGQDAIADNWICTEASSERKGMSIYACGVGTDRDEDRARKNAFHNAELEYWNVCERSLDCHGHYTNIEPKRTTCDKTDTGYKCYRMVVYSILDKTKHIYEIHRPY